MTSPCRSAAIALITSALAAHSASAAIVTDTFDYASSETTLAGASGGTWANVLDLWEHSSRASSPNIMRWKQRGDNGVAGVGPFYYGLSAAYHTGTAALGADQVVSVDFGITDSDLGGINDWGSFGVFGRYQPGIGPGGTGMAVYGRILALPDRTGDTAPTTADLWLRTSGGDFQWINDVDLATLESTTGSLTMTLVGADVTIDAVWGELSFSVDFTIDGSRDALSLTLLNAGAAGVSGQEGRAGDTQYYYLTADLDNFYAADVPEPASLAALLGLGGLALPRRRRD